jgi:hypothetical protein
MKKLHFIVLIAFIWSLDGFAQITNSVIDPFQRSPANTVFTNVVAEPGGMLMGVYYDPRGYSSGNKHHTNGIVIVYASAVSQKRLY